MSAATNALKEIVAKVINEGGINAESTLEDVQTYYERESKHWKVTITHRNGSTSQRNWGIKAFIRTENINSFVAACAASMFHHASTEWPINSEAVRLSRKYDTNIDTANWCVAHPEHIEWLQEYDEDVNAGRKKKSQFKYFFPRYADTRMYLGDDFDRSRAEDQVNEFSFLLSVVYWRSKHETCLDAEFWTFENYHRIIEPKYKKACHLLLCKYHVNRHTVSDYELFRLSPAQMEARHRANKWDLPYNMCSISNEAIPIKYRNKWDGIINEEIAERLQNIPKFTPNATFDRVPCLVWQAMLYAGLSPKMILMTPWLTNKEAHTILFNPLYPWHEGEPKELTLRNATYTHVEKDSAYYTLKDYPELSTFRSLARNVVRFYFTRKYGIDSSEYDLIRDTTGNVHRWLFAKYKDAKLHKVRREFIANEEEVTYSYLSLLDEIISEDLVNGLNTNPDTAFSASLRRKELQWMNDNGEDVPLAECRFAKETEQIKQIKSSKQLVGEGKTMRHCVGGYVKACIKGDSYIFHVEVDHMGKKQVATMEVAYRIDKYTIIQVKSVRNNAAHQSVKNVIIKWAKDNNIAWLA